MNYDEVYWILSEDDNYRKLLLERKLEFESLENSPKKTPDISNLYENLNKDFKECVINLINDLCKECDNVGYNITQIVAAFRKYKMYQNQVANLISEKKTQENYLMQNPENINNRIDRLKKQKSIKKDTLTESMLEDFCDNYLISMELIQKGYGKIFIVNNAHLSKLKEISKKNPNLKSGATLLSVLKSCEQIMKQENIIADNDYLIKEEYAVMTKNGQYLGLNEEFQTAVNNLIQNLYAIQSQENWKNLIISQISEQYDI